MTEYRNDLMISDQLCKRAEICHRPSSLTVSRAITSSSFVGNNVNAETGMTVKERPSSISSPFYAIPDTWEARIQDSGTSNVVGFNYTPSGSVTTALSSEDPETRPINLTYIIWLRTA